MNTSEVKGSSPKSMAYVTVWNSYTNDTSKHYLGIAIPEVRLPGNGTPVVFRSQIGQKVHEAVAAELKESPDLWRVVSSEEPVPDHFGITMINPEGTDMRVYSVRFYP